MRTPKSPSSPRGCTSCQRSPRSVARRSIEATKPSRSRFRMSSFASVVIRRTSRERAKQLGVGLEGRIEIDRGRGRTKRTTPEGSPPPSPGTACSRRRRPDRGPARRAPPRRPAGRARQNQVTPSAVTRKRRAQRSCARCEPGATARQCGSRPGGSRDPADRPPSAAPRRSLSERASPIRRPFRSGSSTTAAARRSDSVMLYSSVPLASVWPSTAKVRRAQPSDRAAPWRIRRGSAAPPASAGRNRARR